MAGARKMRAVDRRALLTSGAAAALLAASGVSLEARPKRGGHLRVALARSGDGGVSCAHQAMFDTLTEVAPDGTLRGELATGWRSDSAARHWVFDLRTDVRFHNGVQMGALDVAASLRRGGLDATAIGAFQVRVALLTGDPHLPYRLADPALSIGVGGGTEIGTGLYAARRMTPGRDFLGTRVAGHYKDGNAGWVDTFELVVIPDPAVRAEALLDGFVDVAELPERTALMRADALRYHPGEAEALIVAQRNVGVPARIGSRAPLDDGRIAERWWID